MLCRYQGQWRKSGESAPGARAQISLAACCEEDKWGRLSPAAHEREEIMCSLGRTSHQSGWIPKEVVNLWEAHNGAGFLAGPVALQWTQTGAACSWRKASCGKDPELEQFVTAHEKEVHGRLSPVERTWQWSTGKSSSLEEAMVKPLCDELTTMPTPCPPVPGRGARESGTKISPGRKGWVGGRYF